MAAALACFAAPALATDEAVLRNGFAIQHEGRELRDQGRITRLFLNASGNDFADVATDQIADFRKIQPSLVSPDAAAAETRLKAEADLFDLAEIVSAAGDRHRIDADLLRSVIRAESGFNSHAVSKRGARGLMQLMPATAQDLGVNDAFNARQNVEGGTRYLRDLLIRYDYDLAKALAAYNAGPLSVEKYHGIPPYRETRAYVARVIRDFNRIKLAQRRPTADSAAGPLTRTSSKQPQSESALSRKAIRKPKA